MGNRQLVRVEKGVTIVDFRNRRGVVISSDENIDNEVIRRMTGFNGKVLFTLPEGISFK